MKLASTGRDGVHGVKKATGGYRRKMKWGCDTSRLARFCLGRDCFVATGFFYPFSEALVLKVSTYTREIYILILSVYLN